MGAQAKELQRKEGELRRRETEILMKAQTDAMDLGRKEAELRRREALGNTIVFCNLQKP